jgi:hypothetical protein
MKAEPAHQVDRAGDKALRFLVQPTWVAHEYQRRAGTVAVCGDHRTPGTSFRAKVLSLTPSDVDSDVKRTMCAFQGHLITALPTTRSQSAARRRDAEHPRDTTFTGDSPHSLANGTVPL